MIDDRETLDMESLLRFYAEAGVDMPLSDTPIDRFAEPQRQSARPAPAQPDRTRPQQQQPRQTAVPPYRPPGAGSN